jgi:transcriptional regulator with XRE-family HTH domain
MGDIARRLGQTIQHHRLAAKLSQEELAARSGLHRTYVSLVERGRRNITVEALCRIGPALGVPASHLLAEAEEVWSRDASADADRREP